MGQFAVPRWNKRQPSVDYGTTSTSTSAFGPGMSKSVVRIIVFAVMGVLALAVVAMMTGIFQDADYMSRDHPDITVPTSEVHTIRITTDEHDIMLKQEGEHWRMTQPIESPVETPAVSAMLRAVGQIVLEQAVTAEKSRYEEFGVSPEIGRRLQLRWDGGVKEFVVAGHGEMYQADYIIVGDDPRVFYMTRRLGMLDDPESLRDKRITHSAPESIKSVDVRGGGRNYTVSRTGDGFSLDSGDAVDATVASRMFSRYSMLRADGFNDDVEKPVVTGEPTLTVTITRESGSEQLHFKDAVTHYLVTSSARDDVFQVASPRVASLAPLRSDLRAE